MKLDFAAVTFIYCGTTKRVAGAVLEKNAYDDEGKGTDPRLLAILNVVLDKDHLEYTKTKRDYKIIRVNRYGLADQMMHRSTTLTPDRACLEATGEWMDKFGEVNNYLVKISDHLYDLSGDIQQLKDSGTLADPSHWNVHSIFWDLFDYSQSQKGRRELPPNVRGCIHWIGMMIPHEQKKKQWDENRQE